jgi:hypothetical protein
MSEEFLNKKWLEQARLAERRYALFFYSSIHELLDAEKAKFAFMKFVLPELKEAIKRWYVDG